MSFAPETPEFYSVPADSTAQERLSGILAGRNVEYMGRISTDAAEQMARAGDNLEPGQVVIDLSKVNLPDIFDMPGKLQGAPVDISINSLITWVYETRDIDNNGSWVAETDNNKTLDRYEDKLLSAVRVADTITEIMQTPDAEDRQKVGSAQTDAYDRKAIVRAYAEAYTRANPDAEFDPVKPSSLKHVGQFINYYREEILREYQLMNISDKLTGFRNELAASLDTPALTRLIGPEAAARLKSHVRNQPLIIADPLTVYMSRGDVKTDYLGWFEPESRRCYIDPLSIDKQADRLKLDSVSRSAQILKTMAHELIHAATNDVHRIWRSSSDPEYQSNRYATYGLWPKFYYEGMTEKLAYAWTYKTRPDLFTAIKHHTNDAAYEVRLRTYFSDNPAETLAPRYVQQAREKHPSSYAAYRLIIDTIMDKADWAAVGLDRHQADKLAIAAFLERPDDTVRRAWPKRKTFMQALHGATQPGIMNTIRYITDNYGPYAALDVLESPDFDIRHDQLKQLISEVHNRRLSIAQRQLAERTAKLNRLEDINSPKFIIEPMRKLVSEAAQVVELKQPLKKAELAYWADLRVRYGTRRRDFTTEERLMRSIFGKAAVTASRHRRVNYGDIDEHRRDLQQWEDGRQQRARLLARRYGQDE